MSKPDPHKRHVVYPEDIQKFNGRGMETARRILRRVRFKLGKNPRDYVTVKELCSVNNYKEDEVRECMKMPLLYFAVLVGLILIFRDDMDLYFLWTAVFIIWRMESPAFRHFWKKSRALLMNPQADLNLPKDEAPSLFKALVVYSIITLALFITSLYRLLFLLPPDLPGWRFAGAITGTVLFGGLLFGFVLILLRKWKSGQE